MNKFVTRDRQGKISGVFGALQPGYGEEELADTDAELAAFLTPATETRADLVEKGIKRDPALDAIVQWLGANTAGKDEQQVISELRALGRKMP